MILSCIPFNTNKHNGIIYRLRYIAKHYCLTSFNTLCAEMCIYIIPHDIEVKYDSRWNNGIYLDIFEL